MSERDVSADKGLPLPESLIDRLNDAFVEANRAEFMDTDFDLPILYTVADLLAAVWHHGYGAGSSDATDGWLKPGSPRTSNPYTTPTAPKEQQ